MLAYVVKAEPVVPASRQLTDPFADLYADGLAIAPPLDPEALLQIADENAAHSACLDAKADDSVGKGWVLEPIEAGEQEPAQEPEQENVGDPGVDAERATDTLAEALEGITPDYTFAELLWQADWERDAIGWSAWEIVKAGGLAGKIAAIYPAPAHTLRCTRDRDVFVQDRAGQRVYFSRFGSGVAVNARTGAKQGDDQQSGTRRRRGTATDVSVDDLATELLMFRGYSSRSLRYPIPRWVAAIPAIAELTAIREYNVGFYGSGGLVDRLIHASAGDQVEAQALADSIKTQLEQAAAEGGGHVSIATGGTPGSGVTVTFLTPVQGRRDGQFGGRRGELIEEVLMGHKVPPYRVSRAITGSLGGSPTREMLDTYRTGTVEPRQGILESRLNQTLFGKPGINLQGFVWRLEDLGWDETSLDLDIATRATDGALITPDEGRELIGKSPSGNPEMGRFYYKGVALGEPRQVAAPFGAGAGALNALETVRQRAQLRLAERMNTRKDARAKIIPIASSR